MEIKGKNYEVIKIIKKSEYPEQDLIICESEYGYRECFQRFDITKKQYDESITAITRQRWTEDEQEKIKKMILEGKGVDEIVNLYDGKLRTKKAVKDRTYILKRELNL